MPTCTHCGLEAGFLRSVHDSCRQRVSAGENAITNLVRFSALNADMAKTGAAVRKLADGHFLPRVSVEGSAIMGLRLAVGDIQAKRPIEDRDVRAIEATALSLGLPRALVQTIGLSDALRRANELRSLRRGQHPVVSDTRGIVLGRSEQALRVFDGVDYQEDVKQRVSVRRSLGASARVGRGLWLHQSMSRGEARGRTSSGSTATAAACCSPPAPCTSRAPSVAFKIDRKQIVCLQQLAGGIGVMKHGVNARWQVFLSEEGGSTMGELAGDG